MFHLTNRQANMGLFAPLLLEAIYIPSHILWPRYLSIPTSTYAPVVIHAGLESKAVMKRNTSYLGQVGTMYICTVHVV